jgi:hypothetical protein
MKNIKNLKVELAGQVGENAVWDGPLSKEGFPMGKGSSKGSSSGKDGLEVSKAPFECGHGTPITSRAKAFK